MICALVWGCFMTTSSSNPSVRRGRFGLAGARLSACLRNFIHDRGGNYAMMMVAVSVPLLMGIGLAVDYSRVVSARQSLFHALDAGVLAAGSRDGLTDAQAQDMITSWLDVHMVGTPATKWNVDTVSQTSDGRIAATASATVDMAFGRILGKDKVTISALNEAKRTLGKVELVMVLDNTGSMRGTKLDNLKRAANELIDTLKTSAANPSDLKMGLVPYTMTVNVGPTNRGKSWLSGSMPAAYGTDIFNTAGTDRFTLFDRMGVAWKGCVEARPTPADVTESPPNSNDKATLYVPYFAPDEPDTTSGQSCGSSGFCNNYMSDGSTSSSWRTRQGNEAKYTKAPKTGQNPIGYQFGPNSGCEVQPLTRLTSDTSTFSDAVAKMVAGGDTDIKAGVMWGWHVLSPNPPFADGVAYNDNRWTKVMVLMTDGQNHNVVVDTSNQSVYSGIGYIWQNRIGLSSGTLSQRIARLDQKLAQACANARTAGIIIYSVVLKDPNVDQSTVRNCASSPDKVFDVENSAGLIAAFRNIGGSIRKLALVR